MSTQPWWKRPINMNIPLPIARALQRLGWTVNKLAVLTGGHNWTIQRVLSGEMRCEKWEDAIQRVLGEAGEYVDVLECFPAEEVSLFSESDALALLPEPASKLEEGDQELIDHMVNTLPPREAKVLRLRFFANLTLEEAKKHLRLRTRQRVQQIEAKALRKLRHPTRIAPLEQVAEKFFAVK